MKFLTVVGFALAAASSVAAANQPPTYLPASDDTVLARLATSVFGSQASDSLETLRRAQRHSPADVDLAVELAEHYLEIGRREGDARYLGHAQGVLAPWWQRELAPPTVRVLRATIRARQHDFESARKDLEAVVQGQRARPALVARALHGLALVHLARGNIASALRHCAAFHRRHPGLLSATCIGLVESIGGKAEIAFRRIRLALFRHRDAEANARSWALGALAEIADRLGRVERANDLYELALTASPRDVSLLTRYADHLLDRGEHQRVQALLQALGDHDSLLVRLTIAEHHLGLPQAKRHATILAARFRASFRRGQPQAHNDARILLDVENRTEDALQLATAAWEQERTPEGALLAVRAATANGSPVPPAIATWLESTGLQSDRIDALLAGQR